MTNPFMFYGTGSSSSVSVNGIKPNIRGNVILPLAKLPDCTIANPTSNQLLVYNGAVWTNENAGTQGVLPQPYINGCGDVTLSNTQNNELLSFDYTSQKWKNKSILNISNIPQIDHVFFSISVK